MAEAMPKKSVVQQIADMPADDRVKALTAMMMLHSATHDRSMLNGLVKSYQAECYRLRAELAIIRTDIKRALSLPYVMNPNVLLILLQPDPDRVEQIATEEMARVEKAAATKKARSGKHK